jgi:hypothetical protein
VINTTPQKVTKVVVASVQEKSAPESGLVRVKFLVPEFKSQFAIPIRMTSEEADMLQVGLDYTIVLEQERLKEGKSGRYPSDYWWGWGGFAAPGTEDQPSPSPTADDSHPPRRDATGVSIERQQALIQANLAYWEYIKLQPEKKPTGFKEAASQITMAAKVFADYLETGSPFKSE